MKRFIFFPYRIFQFIVRNLGSGVLPLILGGFLLIYFYGENIFVRWLLCYFTIGLTLAFMLFDIKKWKIEQVKAKVDQNPGLSLFGLDLVTGKMMAADCYVDDAIFEILGSDKYLRGILPRFIDADVQRKEAVIVIAPQDENNLLEELTKVFRDREKPEQIKPFFYYSSSCPDLSASYSPFYRLSIQCLSSWLALNEKERAILEEFLPSLESTGRLFDLEDILLLLENKKALLVLGDNQRLVHGNYLPQFDMIWKKRQLLAQKLKGFRESFDFDYDAITRACPFDLREIVTRREKHLLIELPQEKKPFDAYLLSQLLCEIDQHYQSYGSEKPGVYVLYPEKLSNYLKERDFELLRYKTTLRIFSTGFYFPQRRRDEQQTIFLPGCTFNKEVLSDWDYKFFQQALDDEKKNLKQNTNLKSLIHEETYEAAKTIATELRLEIACGFFRYYDRESHSHKVKVHWFYPASKTPGRMEYEPYQKRYKPEDMLNLKQLVTKLKYDPSQYDPAVVDIIHDLKPKKSVREK